MDVSEITYRPAVPEDALAGARLHTDCWREAYGPYVDAGLLETALARTDRRVRQWEAMTSQTNPPLLAVHDSHLIGFAIAGPAEEEEPTPQQLYAIYVRQAWWGSGVGQGLLDSAVLPGACCLWVLEANRRARAFYERNGFTADGARDHYAVLDAWEIRMVR